MVIAVITLSTVLGLLCIRWAKMYTRLLESGFAANSHTLCRSLLHVKHNDFILSRDTLWALSFALVSAVLLLNLADPFQLLLCNVLIMLAVLDYYSGLLPDAITLPLMWLGWAYSPLGLVAASSASAMMISMLYLAASLYGLIRKRNGLGGGDIKLLAAIAAWYGLDVTLHILLLASLLGLVFILCIRGKSGQSFVFGPFLAIATIVQMLI